MTKDEFAELMEDVIFQEIRDLRGAGQKEYAGGADAFGNFNRLAQELDTDREKILWTYAMKHKDGIAAWIRGHRSQRESIEGRINDLIVYLCLLRGMIVDDKIKDAKTILINKKKRKNLGNISKLLAPGLAKEFNREYVNIDKVMLGTRSSLFKKRRVSKKKRVGRPRSKK